MNRGTSRMDGLRARMQSPSACRLEAIARLPALTKFNAGAVGPRERLDAEVCRVAGGVTPIHPASFVFECSARIYWQWLRPAPRTTRHFIRALRHSWPSTGVPSSRALPALVEQPARCVCRRSVVTDVGCCCDCCDGRSDLRSPLRSRGVRVSRRNCWEARKYALYVGLRHGR